MKQVGTRAGRALCCLKGRLRRQRGKFASQGGWIERGDRAQYLGRIVRGATWTDVSRFRTK